MIAKNYLLRIAIKHFFLLKMLVISCSYHLLDPKMSGLKPIRV